MLQARDALDLVACKTGHGEGGVGVQVLVHVWWEKCLARDEAEAGRDFFEAFDGFPEALGDYGGGAETFDYVEGHVELVADLRTKLGGCVGDSEEKHSERGDEEPVEDGLVGAVNVGGLVEYSENADDLLCSIDDALGVSAIPHDTGRRVEDRTVGHDADVVTAEVKEDPEPVYGAARGLAVSRLA